MELNEEIRINKFGQGLIDESELIEQFNKSELGSKRSLLRGVSYLAMQSKITDGDIDQAIKNSRLKQSFTPCVMLKKGTANYNLEKIIALPESELEKAYVLLLHLFKVGYKRRFDEERNSLTKWWYWDLSNQDNVDKILSGKY